MLSHRFDVFEAAIAIVRSTWFDEQHSDIRNTLIAGVIQNFQFVHELSAKMIRRQLELEAQDPAEIDHHNFRDVLRIPGERGLIDDLDAWFEYRKLRNLTSHTYDHERAQMVNAQTLTFLPDAKKLLAA